MYVLQSIAFIAFVCVCVSRTIYICVYVVQNSIYTCLNCMYRIRNTLLLYQRVFQFFSGWHFSRYKRSIRRQKRWRGKCGIKIHFIGLRVIDEVTCYITLHPLFNHSSVSFMRWFLFSFLNFKCSLQLRSSSIFSLLNNLKLSFFCFLSGRSVQTGIF